jgi:hypothetical protein
MLWAIQVPHTPVEPLNAANRADVEFNMKLHIVPLILSVALMVGCAGEIVSTDSAPSATDDSADRSFHDTMDRINQQMALDAANAAAQQQFNDAMVAAQQTMNQHNDEFNQNGLH